MVVGGLVISCEVGEIGYQSRKTIRVYAAICECCGRREGLGVMLRLDKMDSDQRLRSKCRELMDLAKVLAAVMMRSRVCP